MMATAKCNINYKGTWYKRGDVLDVADSEKFDLDGVCDFITDTAHNRREEAESVLSDRPRRGRRKAN